MDTTDYLENILNQAEQFINEQKKENIKEQNQVIYKCDCEDKPDVADYSGLILCCKCGVVLERYNISFENEVGMYGGGEDGVSSNNAGRCSGVIDPIMGKSNYSTGISGKGRMQTLCKWSMFDYEETVMMSIKKLFTEAVRELKLPDMLIRQATLCYKSAYNIKIDGKKMIVRGKNKRAVIACCLHFALKNVNIMVPLTDILNYFKVDNTTFAKNCKFLQENLKNAIIKEESLDTCEYIHRLCAKLNIPYKIQNICKMILKACIELSIFPETQSLTVCCASIHFATNELGDQVNLDYLTANGRVSKDTILKTSVVITDNKIKIFNFIKNQKTQ